LATVSFYHYEFYNPQVPFYPGTERRHSFGPRSWYQRAVAATAHPFDATNQDRTLVTDVSVRTTTAGSEFINVTVRNVGRDTIAIYYVDLAEIGP
jgi:hypothetical protein